MMAQIFINALVSASCYLLVGLGFAMVYMTTRFFHFAHGVVITAGAYGAYFLAVHAELHLWPSLIGGILASVLLGVLIECIIYRPLRRRLASPSTLLLASLGTYITLQAGFSLIFGSGTRSFRAGAVPKVMSLWGAYITMPQAWMIIASLACCLTVWLFLQRTRLGKTIRAVACDPFLARACGLDDNRAILIVFLLSSILAGIAGILLAYDSDMTPTMGFHGLLMGMIAMVIGGIGSLPGVAMGSLLLGLLQHLIAWYISSRWQDAILFLILIIFLLIRPRGFVGKLTKKVIS